MAETSIRLDKWLWFARVVKSRTLAQKLVRSGGVRLNKNKLTNPAKLVGSDDVLTIAVNQRVMVLKIVACGQRRGPFSEASKLYDDLTQYETTRDSELPRHHQPPGPPGDKLPRPDKQKRRKLLQLKQRQYFR